MHLKLYVRKDIGKGKLVILLHGLFGDGTQWEKCTALLVQSGHRVVTLDLLGHGKSPKPRNTDFNAKDNVIALRNALESINATEDATVVGYSMGGAVALSYCAAYPNSASELIIISTPFYLKPEQMLRSRYAVSLFITKMSGYTYSAVNHLLKPGKPLHKLIPRTDDSKKFHEMIGAYDNKLDPRVVQGSIKHLVHKYDFAGELSKVKIPVSFYCGKKDAFIVHEQLYALKQFCPNMDIERLDIIKVDHMLVQNLPKEIARIISKDDNRLLHIANDVGQGDPLILLHGIESSSSYWKNVIPALSENNKIITIDLLGYGNSPKPTNIAYSTEDHIKSLCITIQNLGIKKYKIAAHSLGSILALAYAAEFPQEISELYLFAPVLKQKDIKSRRFLVDRMKFINAASDTGVLHPEIARAIGDKRIKQIIPSIRTVQNTIQKQQPEVWASKISDIPVTFAYGTLDSLVDSTTVTKIASKIKKPSIISLEGKGHNFALTNPDIIVDIIDKKQPHKHQPKPASKIPKNFVRQIASMAAPSLMLKSCIYILFGILLFSHYATATVTIGLAAVIINKSYKIIRGAFSLKNEGLAYLGYLFLGIFIALVGYGLVKHPEDSAKIAVFLLCGAALITGILRLMAAIFWTKQKNVKKFMYLTGAAMTIVGLAAILGGIISTWIIIYSLAIYLCIRGILYGSYATTILSIAFIRGYDKS